MCLRPAPKPSSVTNDEGPSGSETEDGSPGRESLTEGCLRETPHSRPHSDPSSTGLPGSRETPGPRDTDDRIAPVVNEGTVCPTRLPLPPPSGSCHGSCSISLGWVGTQDGSTGL